MRLHLTLALLLGVLLVVAHGQDDTDHSDTEAEMRARGEDPHAVGEHDEEEPEEGDDEGQDFGPEDEEGEDDEMEKMDPLTPEMIAVLHKKADVNGNGKVSLAEATDFAHKMRRELAQSELNDIMKDQDADKDGKLSWLEFLGDASRVSEADQNEKQKEFKELDVNHDNLVDPDELASLYHHHTNDKVETTLTNLAMKDKDADGNGVLTLQEFFQHLQTEGEDPVDIEEEDKEIFKKLDTDASGTLTLTELKAWESGSFQAEEAMRKLFVKADKNKDNVLTVEELTEVREELAEDKEYEPQMYLSQWAEQHTIEHGEL